MMAPCWAEVRVAPLGSVIKRVTAVAVFGPSFVNVAVKVPEGWPGFSVAGPFRLTVTSAEAPIGIV